MSLDAGALLGWYERVKRPLPWRATRDPYALLVSEVMLQQTQAARVVPYYHAFLERFPDPHALAAAPAADVLAAWSGLGYNRRALALQRAAAHVAAHGWPEDLTELPGVGAYTAAAVASFAWDAQAAAVDTNVRRVLCAPRRRRARAGALARRAAELRAGGPGGGVQPGDDGARRHRLPPAAARVRRLPRARGLRVGGPGAGAAAAPVGRAARAVRGQRPLGARADRRRARGRRGAPPLAPARRERAEAGLLRDGLAVRGADGALRLP